MSDDYDRITVTLPPEGYGKRTVLKNLLTPYSYAYMAVIRSLDKLLNYGLIESEFVRICIHEITQQVDDGQCKYGKFSSEKVLKQQQKTTKQHLVNFKFDCYFVLFFFSQRKASQRIRYGIV